MNSVKPYWYFLHTQATDHRLWVMVDKRKKTGDRIELVDCLGYTERIHNGSWLCFVRVDRRAKCIGGELSSKEARARIYLYYKGAVENGEITTQSA